jgi:1,2-diacylglycerol 3-alpha-glucosyltransferase
VRIALVTDYYLPTLGGVQTVIKAHKESLERAGHEVIVFAPLATPSLDPSVRRLPTARRFAPDGYPFAWPPSEVASVLRQALRTEKFDVVHVHTEMFAALGAFEAGRALGVPVVQTMHGRIDVYTRSVLPLPSVTTALLAALHRRRLPHDPLRSGSREPYARTRTARRMWRLMVSQANAADQVIVPSSHFAAKLRAQGVVTPLHVLSNGLEESVLDQIGPATVRQPDAGEPLRVVWCGRLSPEKRPEVFVDAIAAAPGVEAHMYGDGVSRRVIARRAAALPAGRLTVHGPVPQTAVLEAMRGAHVLVSTSFDFDNQPMVILEAVAAGLPVVVTDPDLLEALPVRGGLATSTPDAPGLARLLAELGAAPARLADMSTAAIAHRPQIAQTTHLDALIAVYRAAIEG